MRKIIKDPLCPICGSAEEIICHVLWSYIATINVWAEALSPLQKWGISKEELQQIWKKLVENLSIPDLELVVTIIRNIWLRINQYVYENIFLSSRLVLQKAKLMFEEFQKAASEGSSQPKMEKEASMKARWKPLDR